MNKWIRVSQCCDKEEGDRLRVESIKKERKKEFLSSSNKF